MKTNKHKDVGGDGIQVDVKRKEESVCGCLHSHMPVVDYVLYI